MTPVILITAGEPASIAPDICIKVAKRNWQAKLVFLTDPELLKQRSMDLNEQVKITQISDLTDAKKHSAGNMFILPNKLLTPCFSGQLNKSNSPFVIQSIKKATQLCLAKKANAMVTPPVHKGIINDFGDNFTGHTEYIANICQAEPVMMLASKQMRVALATTHLPLKEVSGNISTEGLVIILKKLFTDLKVRFKITNPKVLICGLNPHAGENGYLGKEEKEIIEPAIKIIQKQGFNAMGPYPADTIFNKNNLNKADTILAMYHDQGLPVLKYASFGEAINITLGLPIVRVSVDHGTALDLAGTNQVDSGSMEEAISLAIKLS